MTANGGKPMTERSSIGASAFLAAFLLTTAAAQAWDDAKYPDLSGAWDRATPGAPRFDPSKSPAEQNPPLTAEYKKIYDTNNAAIAAGGHGDHPIARCLAWGMPAMMTLYGTMEVVITPEVTYLMIDDGNDSFRRIFTDGRSFSPTAETSYVGYSVGRWLDEDGDGKYDVLEVETRNLKGPRAADNSGLLFHSDNESIIKERIYLDKRDPNTLHNEVTVIDHALTRPWVVVKDYKRDSNPLYVWREDVCAEKNNQVIIGNQNYLRNAEGYLTPARRDQEPPDLRHFKK
jgi:hypothetical protein